MSYFTQKTTFSKTLFNIFTTSIQKTASPKNKNINSKFLNFLINTISTKIRHKKIKEIDSTKNHSHFALETFINNLKQSKVISFDIFDTLLIRKVQRPIDIFKIIEIEENAPGFQKIRIDAELRARANSKDADITLDDIYRFIPLHYKKLQTIEIQKEIENITPNPHIKQIYDVALLSKKPIIATSDMYLNVNTLRFLLDKNGFSKIEKIFVSSAEKATKNKGTLFNHLSNKLKIPISQLTHIGDNKKSDFLIPQKMGCRAQWFPRIDIQLYREREKYFLNKQDIASSVHNSLVLRYLPYQNCTNNLWHEYGYMIGGPLVLSYLFWIHQRAQYSDIDHLSFIARDGWILQKIFSDIFPETSISTSYVYISRHIALLSTLSHGGNPRYIKYILSSAEKEGIIHKDDITTNNLQTTFNSLHTILNQWADRRKIELRTHLEKRIGNSKKQAFVELNSGHLSGINAGHTILGSRNVNNFIFTFSGKLKEIKIGDLPFEYAIQADDKDFRAINLATKRRISSTKILEKLISSPENRILSLQNNTPIYGRESTNLYYKDVAKGISDYVHTFLSERRKPEAYILPIEEAAELLTQFSALMSESDIKTFDNLSYSDRIGNI